MVKKRLKPVSNKPIKGDPLKAKYNINGRPTKLTDDRLELMEILFLKKKTDREIACLMGISIASVMNYRKKDPKFLEAIKAWKETADEDVERSLYERARGYDCVETKTHMTKEGEIICQDVVKQYPPDPASMIFWLKNRQPAKYREKIEHELGAETLQTFKLGYKLGDSENENK